MAQEERKYIGAAGAAKLIEKTRAEISAGDAKTLQDAKSYANGLATNYDAAGTAATKVQELASGQVKTNTENIAKNTDAIGALADLETTAKDDLVVAINEVRDSVASGAESSAVTVVENTSPSDTNVLKSYTIKQGATTVGTINIPKDMVVKSGEVVTNPTGQAAGTYIKLVLANATNDVIYVNVGTLVDVYKAKASAAQVQLAINSSTREISASIVAGSISSTELGANAVITAKIADGNVTKAKLASEVQTALNKAHEHGNASVLDGITAEQVAAWDLAETNANAYTNGEILDVTTACNNYTNTQMGVAQRNAINHANELDDAMNLRVEALEGVTYTEITAAEVEAMFTA